MGRNVVAVAVVDYYDVRLPDAAVVSDSGDGHVLTRCNNAHAEQEQSRYEIEADGICPRFHVQEGFEVGPHAVQPPWMLAACCRLIPLLLWHAVLALDSGYHLLGKDCFPMFHSEYGNHITKLLGGEHLHNIWPVELLLDGVEEAQPVHV